jgi:Phage integrase family
MDLEGQLRGWSAEQRRVVFPTAEGRMVCHAHFIESVWQPFLSKAGGPYRKYHATRHTYATWMLETGADLRWVSQQMGHASLKQTADTYGHLIVDRHEATTGAIHSPEPNVAPGGVRTPLEPGLCAVRGRRLTGRQPQRVCSPRCRIARWRQTRARETAATIARLLAENAALRQRVGELERLVGQLKRRLWPTA